MIRRRVHPSVCAAFAAIASVAVAAEPAPDFTLTDTYGQPVSLKAYRGSVLWISFGATW
ncbi:MAG: redoxin domain-containing protein [Phycisphaerae bacterium]|nr:redoxin domain-containing protein [Phycisphaerae bacterium]